LNADNGYKRFGGSCLPKEVAVFGETTAVFFQTELRWPPAELFSFRISENMIVGLFDKLREPDFNEYCYKNLELELSRPTLSVRRNGTRNVIQFDVSSSAPSITIEESKPISHVDQFERRVTNILLALASVVEEQELDVPEFFLQRCKIQCLAQPHNADNSLVLLADGVANVFERIEPFERPPCHFGVRFRFPPAEIDTGGDGGVKTHRNFATVRFETYEDDPRQVWMEVASEYLLYPDELKLSDTNKITDHVRKSYDFLTQQCVQFLNQFDEEFRSDSSQEGEEEQ